jgi:DNA-binding HxlR family transcriptional regulator
MEWSADNCTVGRTMAILGERWTVVVLREVFMGVRRFAEITERSGIPRQVLSDRLTALVDEGILRRVPYQERGSRVREEYRLTDKGFDLYPVLIAVKEWGDRYLADPEGAPVLTVHSDCGAEVGVSLECGSGHHIESLREIVPRPGPGALRRQRVS